MPDRNDNDRNRDRKRDNDRRGTPHYSLKAREYRGPDGQIHHHTNTYMQQHDVDGSRGRDGNRDKNR